MFQVLDINTLCRWVVIMSVALASISGLASLRIDVDLRPQLISLVVSVLIQILAFATCFFSLQKKFLFLQRIGVFVGALAECWIFFMLAGGLQYLAASANFPLADEAFLEMDKILTFSWSAYAEWVARNPSFYTMLDVAYWSFFYQIIVLCFMHSMRGNYRHNAELLWGLMISLLICSAISMLLPAIGYPGTIGQHHIDVLLAARNGVVLDVAGIITFPSFHAVMGVLFAYSARTIKPLFIVFVPLNILLLLATPPFGGHYLTDVIGGAGVAIFTIYLMRSVKGISHALTWPIRISTQAPI